MGGYLCGFGVVIYPGAMHLEAQVCGRGRRAILGEQMTQWVYHDHTPGRSFSVMVDIEKVGARHEGSIVVHRDEVSYFELGTFQIDEPDVSQTIVAQFSVYASRIVRLLTDDEVAEIFPQGYQHVVSIDAKFETNGLTASWKLSEGPTKTVKIPKWDPTERSEVEVLAEIATWSDFTTYCSRLPERSRVFRGQNTGARLRTAFHRRGRSNLFRFMNQDMKGAYRALSGKTRHRFDEGVPDENAAFMNLLQHHGFPTPMLDWTESPFIAAYFAFHHRRHAKEDQDEKVRILCFDAEAWQRDLRAYPFLIGVGPHVTVLMPLAIENPRASPQQALSMITNIDDIERYIRELEASKGTVYLQAIELPYGERSEALKDLAMMGITQGTLFPGIDGTCEDLRDRYFGRA